MNLWKEAYFPSTISAEAISYRNIALVSDMGLVGGIFKAVMYQANANKFRVRCVPKKKTFLFRSGKSDH